MDILYRLRDEFNYLSYKYLWKPIFFRFDPEAMHKFFVFIGKSLGRFRISKLMTKLLFDYEDEVLKQKIKGVMFRNPIGLSAGFDKNAEMIPVLENTGFGFLEVGSVTALASEGNKGIRLLRVPEKKSLWVNFGLNNEGVKIISRRIASYKSKVPVAVSIAKTNCKTNADTDEGIKDYLFSLDVLKNVGDFFIINVSCPNSYGGRDFCNPVRYEKLMKEINRRKIKKMIFAKISPDMSKGDLNKVIAISKRYKIAGFVCTNLTKKNIGYSKGGLSGKVVEKKSEEFLRHIYTKTKGEFILIGVGGVFSAEDAYRKIKSGANLVSLFTGMIYEGPGIMAQINREIKSMLAKDGYKNVGEAVGKGV